jgi:hypothetical protein
MLRLELEVIRSKHGGDRKLGQGDPVLGGQFGKHGTIPITLK